MLNVTCPQGALHEAVQIVSRGVTGRSTQPVQNNILLEAKGDQLRLAATDLELISIDAAIPVTLAEEGEVTVPSRLLSELVGTLPVGDVTLASDEHDALTLTCGEGSYSIRGLAAADFQMLPEMGEALNISIPQGQLSEMLRQTVFATSRDETRPILTGALFEFSAGSLQIVATDTYRLALRKAAIELELETPTSAIVSARALQEVLRTSSPEIEEPVAITVSDNQVQFQVGNVKIGSRLIEGQFPNYQKVVPESHEKRLTVSVGDLEHALRRALVVAREDANRIVLSAAADGLTITAESQDVGNVKEHVPGELDGEPTEIAFNARYMLDLLEAIEAERVNIDLAGPLNPGMIRCDGNEDYLYVLMPMQIM